MKIKSIILNNFGSYMGENIFNMHTTSERNIVLIGGKNGAGKTTLFTAIRLCLYGYMSMGYKNQNSYYTRSVTKLINNTAKMVRPTSAYVTLEILISNGHEEDLYKITRSWIVDNSLSEMFAVEKNGNALNADETADFEKYIMSLIPPELFNLYFFDGEKIADFFLDEGGNTRIKGAFLTLCGYDTFEIMRKNFKRISTGVTQTNSSLQEYLSAKVAIANAQKRYNDNLTSLNNCIDEISICEADIIALEKDYQQKGGISQEEWNDKLLSIKEEEKKRENWNALIKKWSNELIPFLMIKKELSALRDQITKENSDLKFRNFFEILDMPEVNSIIGSERVEAVKSEIARRNESTGDPVLDLSLEQSALLMSQIDHVLGFDEEKVRKCKNSIKRSISKTNKIRQELDTSNISSVQLFMQRKAELFEMKSTLLEQRVELEFQVSESKAALEEAEQNLTRLQAKLENELKQASITDISARAIIMLDKLQDTLYRQQIEKVETFFRTEIKTLMRKTQFIDDIFIDDTFNVHLYRNEEFSISKLREMIKTNTEEQLATMLGKSAIQNLKDKFKVRNLVDINKKRNIESDVIELRIEIDKNSLSNGEKQIFIMALYHSLIQLCKHEVPFVIDTPFARIDTEHRINISTHFFSKIKGQVFILSTNEEIDSEHMQILDRKISSTYILENSDNKQTNIVQNSYFEV